MTNSHEVPDGSVQPLTTTIPLASQTPEPIKAYDYEGREIAIIDGYQTPDHQIYVYADSFNRDSLSLLSVKQAMAAFRLRCGMASAGLEVRDHPFRLLDTDAPKSHLKPTGDQVIYRTICRLNVSL